METKQCSRCKKELTLDLFYKNKIKNSLFPYCKECSKTANKKYNKDNKEKLVKKTRVWRKLNLEKAKLQKFRNSLRRRYREMTSKSKYYCSRYTCYFETLKTCNAKLEKKEVGCKDCTGPKKLEKFLNVSEETKEGSSNVYERICKSDSCSLSSKIDGYCLNCYDEQQLKQIEIEKKEVELSPFFCKEEGCFDKVVVKGYCKKHYQENYIQETRQVKKEESTSSEKKLEEKSKVVKSKDLDFLQEVLEEKVRRNIEEFKELVKELEAVKIVQKLFKDNGNVT